MRAARSRLLVFSSTHVVLVAKCVFAEVYLLPGLEARVVRLSVSEGVGRGGAEEGDDESGGRVGGQRGGGSGLETRECSRVGIQGRSGGAHGERRASAASAAGRARFRGGSAPAGISGAARRACIGRGGWMSTRRSSGRCPASPPVKDGQKAIRSC